MMKNGEDAGAPWIEVLSRGVCVREGRLLLCRTAGSPVTYLPGGHVEFGERARDALERELDEELGLRSRAGRFLGACEHLFDQRSREHAEINLVFEVEIFGITPENTPLPRESWLSFGWHPLRELTDSRLEPALLREWLPRWLQGDEPGERFGSGPGNWRTDARNV